ncbi:hypothetical protein Sjap_014303 [Stephania japonica]|uniref:Uncharacterized protein n=1 Tax=Stephania japonica TaxID=461633 RepID=A0AAP0IZL4_9MAGN
MEIVGIRFVLHQNPHLTSLGAVLQQSLDPLQDDVDFFETQRGRARKIITIMDDRTVDQDLLEERDEDLGFADDGRGAALENEIERFQI